MSLTAAELRAVYSVDEGPLDRSLAALPGRVEGTTSRLSKVAGAIGTGLVAGTAIIGSGLMAAGALGIKTAADMEQANIGFTTMLGSAQKAGTFLKQLQQFAASTPFEFPELETAASSLISVGIDSSKVIPIMTTLGNVTSGMGTGSEGIQRATVAIQQMTAAGKIQAEDLNQLRDAGIPVYDLLSAALGKTKAEVVDMANKGKLGQDALDKMMGALESGNGLERFSGLMDKQSQSLSGLASTFKDTVSMGLAQAIQPMIPMLKDGMANATTIAAAAVPVLVHGLTDLLQISMDVSRFITTDVIPAVTGMAHFISENRTPIEIVAGIIAAVFLPHLIALGVQSLVTGARTVAGWVMGQAAAIAAGAVHSAQIVKMIAGWVLLGAQAAAQGIKVAAVWTAQVVASAVSGAVSFGLQVGRVVAGWVLMGVQSLIQAARMAAAWFIALGPVGWVTAAVIALVALIVANWDTVVSWTQTAWSAVTGFIAAAWNWITGAVSAALGFLVALFLNFTGPGLIISHWNAIVNFTRTAWNAVTGTVAGAWNAIVGAVAGGVGAVTSYVQSIPGRIMGALGNIGSLLWNAGRSVIEGFINGIKSMIGAVASTLGGITSKLTSWKGPPSTDRMILHSAGQLVMQGFIGGLESQYGGVKSSLQGLTADLAGMAPVLPSALSGLGNAQATSALTARRPAGASTASPAAGTAGGPAAGGPLLHIDNYVAENGTSPAQNADALSVAVRTRPWT